MSKHTVRPVEFHTVKPSLLRPHSGLDKVFLKLLNLTQAQPTGLEFPLRLAGTDGLLANEVRRGSDAGVVELDRRHSAVLLDSLYEGRYARERFDTKPQNQRHNVPAR